MSAIAALHENVARRKYRLGREVNWLDLTESSDPGAQEWARERIDENGPGQELIRRVVAEQCRGEFKAFLSAANTLDIVALSELFKVMHDLASGPGPTGQASIVEAFLTMVGLDPTEILNSGRQRMPIPRS